MRICTIVLTALAAFLSVSIAFPAYCNPQDTGNPDMGRISGRESTPETSRVSVPPAAAQRQPLPAKVSTSAPGGSTRQASDQGYRIPRAQLPTTPLNIPTKIPLEELGPQPARKPTPATPIEPAKSSNPSVVSASAKAEAVRPEKIEAGAPVGTYQEYLSVRPKEVVSDVNAIRRDALQHAREQYDPSRFYVDGMRDKSGRLIQSDDDREVNIERYGDTQAALYENFQKSGETFKFMYDSVSGAYFRMKENGTFEVGRLVDGQFKGDQVFKLDPGKGHQIYLHANGQWVGGYRTSTAELERYLGSNPAYYDRTGNFISPFVRAAASVSPSNIGYSIFSPLNTDSFKMNVQENFRALQGAIVQKQNDPVFGHDVRFTMGNVGNDRIQQIYESVAVDRAVEVTLDRLSGAGYSDYKAHYSEIQWWATVMRQQQAERKLQ